MPCSIACLTERELNTLSLMRISPPSGLRPPDNILMSVLLPEPLSPTIAVTSPLKAVKSTPRRASIYPNLFHFYNRSIHLILRYNNSVRVFIHVYHSPNEKLRLIDYFYKLYNLLIISIYQHVLYKKPPVINTDGFKAISMSN